MSNVHEIRVRDDHIRYLELENMRLQVKLEQAEKDTMSALDTVMTAVKMGGRLQEQDFAFGDTRATVTKGKDEYLFRTKPPSEKPLEPFPEYNEKAISHRPSMARYPKPVVNDSLLDLDDGGNKDWGSGYDWDASNNKWEDNHVGGRNFAGRGGKEDAKTQGMPKSGWTDVTTSSGLEANLSWKLDPKPATTFHNLDTPQFKHFFSKNKEECNSSPAEDDKKITRVSHAILPVQAMDKHCLPDYVPGNPKVRYDEMVYGSPIEFQSSKQEKVAVLGSPIDLKSSKKEDMASAAILEERTRASSQIVEIVQGPGLNAAKGDSDSGAEKTLLRVSNQPDDKVRVRLPPAFEELARSSAEPCSDSDPFLEKAPPEFRADRTRFCNGGSRFHGRRGDRDYIEPLPLYYKYGIKYSPTTNEKNVYRTVIIGNLPPLTDVADIVARARESPFFAVKLIPTFGMKIKRSDGYVGTMDTLTATVLFFLESSAEQFVFDIEQEPLIIRGRMATVTLLKTATYPSGLESGVYGPPTGRSISRHVRFYQPSLVPAGRFEAVLEGQSYGFRNLGWIVDKSCKKEQGRNVVTVEFASVDIAAWACRRLLHDPNFIGCEPRFIFDHDIMDKSQDKYLLKTIHNDDDSDDEEYGVKVIGDKTAIKQDNDRGKSRDARTAKAYNGYEATREPPSFSTLSGLPTIQKEAKRELGFGEWLE